MRKTLAKDPTEALRMTANKLYKSYTYKKTRAPRSPCFQPT
jgi:hypothetical protein